MIPPNHLLIYYTTYVAGYKNVCIEAGIGLGRERGFERHGSPVRIVCFKTNPVVSVKKAGKQALSKHGELISSSGADVGNLVSLQKCGGTAFRIIRDDGRKGIDKLIQGSGQGIYLGVGFGVMVKHHFCADSIFSRAFLSGRQFCYKRRQAREQVALGSFDFVATAHYLKAGIGEKGNQALALGGNHDLERTGILLHQGLKNGWVDGLTILDTQV